MDSRRIPLSAEQRKDRKGPYPYYGANGQVDSINDYIFSGEHILLAEDGGFFDQRGRGVAYLVDGNFWVNNHAHILKMLGEIDQRLLTHWFNAFDWMPYVGGTTRLKLTQGVLRTVKFPLPPLNEQRRIAAKIESLQARSKSARNALEEAQALLEQLRQSILTAAFTGKLTEKWRVEHPDAEPATELLQRIRKERRKRWEEAELAKYAAKGKTPPAGWQKKYPEPVTVDTSDLPELPEGWCWASLDELAWASDYGTSVKCGYEGGGEAVLRIPNVVNSVIATDDLKYSIKSLEIAQQDALTPGDMLIIRTNGSLDLVGRSAIVTQPFDKITYFASYLIRYRLMFPKILTGWIESLWNSIHIRQKIENLAVSAAGQNNISMSKLATIALPIPSETELRYLKGVLSSALSRYVKISDVSASANASLSALDQSILAKAFRGELVPQDPNDEPASKLLERVQNERQGSGATKPSRVRRRPNP